MTGARDVDPDALRTVLGLEPDASHRAEAVFGELAEHGLVEGGEDLGRPVAFQGDGADSVAGEGRHRCRLDPLAPHVPDGAEPPVLDGVYEVVEVPSHVVGLPDGQVLGADLDAWYFGQVRWKQAPLQDVCDLAAVPVETGVVRR